MPQGRNRLQKRKSGSLLSNLQEDYIMPKRQPATPDQQSQEQAQDQTAQAAAPAQEMPPIHLDVRVRPITPKGNLLGYASVNMNGCFAVDGIKVISGKNGLFTAMPSYQDGSGQYKEVCFPVSKEFHKQLNTAVLDGYHQALEQMREASVKAMQQAQAPQEAPEMPGPEMAM